MNLLVPAVDPAALPGPVWLFHLLWVVTFTIHLLLVNAVLGGTVLSAVALARDGSGLGRHLCSWFAGINTWAISFAITFAIAPLLFMQVLYGRFFYSATILVAGAWLGMLALLTVAYYLNYLVKRRLKAVAAPLWLVLLQALLFLAIAGIQVVVSLLHQRPDRWGAVSDLPWAALNDPTLVPRYLHFVLAAVAMSGAVLAWWKLRGAAPGAARPDTDRTATKETGAGGGEGGVSQAALSGGAVRFGIQAALAATALQLPVGFWMLFALPRPVLIGFMRGGAATMVPLTVAILTGVAALVVLALCLSPPARPRLARHATELIGGTAVLMVITRHQLREVYLAPVNAGVAMSVAPQWGVIGLFVLCLLAAGALTAVVLARAARERPGPGEDTA